MSDNTIEIDVKVNDNGTTEKVAMKSKKAGDQFDKTADQANRYHKGQKGVAQATANSTKAFSKMQGGMTGMVGIYAEIASRVFALSAAFQFLKDASDVTNLIAGQEAMGAATGVAYKTITADLKAATDGQLAYADAARAAAIGTAAGLSASQLTEIGKAARNVSNALGRDLRDSFERLTRGITKAEPELLDELGIILRLETAKKNYATQIGKTASSLTQFEQSQAIANEVLTQAEEKFGKIEQLMDPSAASLNKFLTSFDDLMNTLKQGTMSVLRPVFDFLSENTTVLIGTLGLLGTTVLRSILPNMTEWRNSSKAAADSARADMFKYKGQLDAARRSLDQFNQSQMASKANAVSLASKSMGDFGTVTKGGGGAKDFFSGMSDTKRARSNARRVLEAAEREYDEFGKVTTGMLKGYNAQQLADMRASYNMRAAVLDQQKQKHKFTLDSMRLHWSVLKTHAIAQLAAIKAAMSGFAAFATKWGGRLMSAFGWGSLLIMIGGYVKDLMNAGLPDHLKKANKESKELGEKLSGLTDELKKMDDVQTSGMLSVMELTSQIGKASASADLHGKILQYQALAQSGAKEATEQAKAELIKTAAALTNLDPRYKKFLKQLQHNGRLSKTQLQALKNTTNEMIEQGAAVDNLTNATKAFTDAIRALNTGVKPMNPFLDMLNTATILKDTLGTAIKGGDNILDAVMPQEFMTARKNLEDTKKAHVHQGTPGRGFFKSGIDNFLGNKNRDGNYESAIREAMGQKVFEDQTDKNNAIELANEALEKQKGNLTEGQKAVLELGERYEDIGGLIKQINKFSQETVDLAYEDIGLKYDNQALMNTGVSIQDRLNNLKIAANNDQIKENDLQAKFNTAQIKLESALRDRSENKQAIIDAAVYEYNVTLQNLEVEKQRARIQKEMREHKENMLELERKLNPLIATRNANEILLLKKQRDLKSVESGTQSFGFSQAALIRTTKGEILQRKIAIAINKQNEAQTKLSQETAKTGGITVARQNQLTNNLNLAKQAVQTAQQELRIHNQLAAGMENELRAKTQLAYFNQDSLGFNTLQAQFNAEVLKYYQAGIPANQINLDLIKAQLQTQQEITREMADQQHAYDAVRENLAGTIASLIKGEESSFSEAIKSMADGIMKSIADRLAQNMADMILDKVFKLKNPAVVQMQQAHTAGGKTLNTNIKDALSDGGNTLAEKIKDACSMCCSGETTDPTKPLEDKIPTKDDLQKKLQDKLKGELDSDVNDMVKKDRDKDFKVEKPEINLDSLKEDLKSGLGFDKEGGFMSGLKDSFKTIMGDLKGMLSGMFKNLLPMLKGLFTPLLGALKGIGGGLLGLFGFANGGIMSNGKKVSPYSTGGIAKGSKRGYPAVLHGTEAVVPLPDGKTIPVSMENTGSGMQQNNVTVNISSEGQSRTEGDGPDMKSLGESVAAAVQKELQYQKRSGGILSPYGVA